MEKRPDVNPIGVRPAADPPGTPPKVVDIRPLGIQNTAGANLKALPKSRRLPSDLRFRALILHGVPYYLAAVAGSKTLHSDGLARVCSGPETSFVPIS